ncbi:hypothetical protein [Collimonas sp. OK307]|uniref:hypothetical protein n=1 Tax=Collimonas sp. OK307 TaxID=1801620 RepID=UPI001114031A|nr:hypothetical protein [Collimonas sp. OK307]
MKIVPGKFLSPLINLAAQLNHKIFYIATKIILACEHFAKSGYCRFTKLPADLPRLLFVKNSYCAESLGLRSTSEKEASRIRRCRLNEKVITPEILIGQTFAKLHFSIPVLVATIMPTRSVLAALRA